MGGFATLLGHAAGGFEQARQQDLSRQHEDEQNRRAMAGSLLQHIALDENQSDEVRNASLQSYNDLASMPGGQNYNFKKSMEPIFGLMAQHRAKVLAAQSAPPQQFTPPPLPPMQLGGSTVPGPALHTVTGPPPPPPSLLASAPEVTGNIAQRAGAVAGAQAGQEMGGQVYQAQPNGGMSALPIMKSGAPGAPIQNAISPYALQGRGESNINYVDPTTGQTALGTYNRITQHVYDQNQQIVPNAVPIIPSMLPTEHQGFTYQTQSDGSVVAIPVTTTSQKVLPGKSGPPAPPSASVTPSAGKRVGAMKPPQAIMIAPPAVPGGPAQAINVKPGSQVPTGAVTPGGLSSANVPTGTIRTMAQRSQGQLASIQQLTDTIDQLDKAGKLGPVAGRWNDFLQGRVGAGDPDYSYFNDKAELLQSAMMLIHAGGRGSTPILKKFEGMLDAGKMDAPTLKAGIRAIKEQMVNYAKEGKIPGFDNAPPAPPAATSSSDWSAKYNATPQQ